MSEDTPRFRVIDGGKKELRELGKRKTEPTEWDRNIARVRTFSPSLDQYLTQRPTDRLERMILLRRIRDELWAMPAGGADTRNTASQRNQEKHGKRERTKNYLWQDATDQQIAWDERYTMEYANAIAEKMTAIEQEELKIRGLEDHLTEEAAKAYGDNDDFKP
jgi:PAS domain-containing protein